MDIISDQLYPAFLAHPIVCTDSRNPVPGSIFFALSGPSFNGNTFAAKALEDGCAIAIIDDASFGKDERYIVVPDSLKALQDLARLHRRSCKALIFGITGSNGKTTTKELLHTVLQRKFKCIATTGNLNNQIGVPLTLLRIQADTELAVIEMGASKQGDIKELMEIAEPDFGLITNIGKAHLEGMGGFEGVIKTKSELYDWLRQNEKTAFVNTMQAVFVERSKGIKQITLGTADSNDVQGEFVNADPFVNFRWKARNHDGRLSDSSLVSTNLLGSYNFENLLAAVTAGNYFGLSAKEINEAVSSYVPVNNRSQVVKTENNQLILDAYNANPTSMEAAITNFKGMASPNKIVILGKMMELGPESAQEHKRIGELAVNSGFDQVYFVGQPYRDAGVTATKIFNDVQEAIASFKTNPVKGATVLIKGSRANLLELLSPVF